MTTKTSKGISKTRQKTNNKIFLIRLKLALKQASNTEVEETALVVQQELNRRYKKK